MLTLPFRVVRSLILCLGDQGQNPGIVEVLLEAEGEVGRPLNWFKPPSHVIFLLLTNPRQYF